MVVVWVGVGEGHNRPVSTCVMVAALFGGAWEGDVRALAMERMPPPPHPGNLP